MMAKKRMNGMLRDELNRKVCAWIVRGGIAAVMNARQTYTAKHIQKGPVYSTPLYSEDKDVV